MQVVSPVQEACLTPLAADGFGFSVALSGDRALVGAVGEDAGNTDAGAAYVYFRTAGVWKQEARLVAPDGPGYYGFFGFAVALTGDRAFITDQSYRNDVFNRGAVHVFVRSGTEWTHEALLLDPDTFWLFGRSVSVSGNRVIVGAPFDGETGAAHLFSRVSGGWQQTDVIAAADSAAGDNFGSAVALSDGHAIIGANGAAAAGRPGVGAAYVFSGFGPMGTDSEPAARVTLSLPWPHPAAGRTSLTLRLDVPQNVRTVVVDALSREVAVLLDGEVSGTTRLDIDTARLAPGVYVVRVIGETVSAAQRMTVVR